MMNGNEKEREVAATKSRGVAPLSKKASKARVKQIKSRIAAQKQNGKTKIK